MRKLFTLILIVSTLLMLAGCESNIKPDNEERVVEKVIFAAKELEHTKSLSPYSFDVYNTQVLKQHSNKSVIFSPISHHLTLAMMLNEPDDDGSPIFNGLTMQETNELCKKIIDRLAYKEEGIEKSLFNCYIFNTAYNTPNVIAPILANWYYADTFEEDFNDVPKVTKLFLDWINSKSKEIQLTSLPIQITSATHSLYSNVINFKGDWTDSFNKELTKKKDFTSLDKKVSQVDMMQQINDFLYYEGKGIKAAELPYGKEGKYSMTVVITDDGNLSYENWLLIQNGLKSEHLNLQLPKFTIETPRIDFIIPIANARLIQIAKIETDEKGSKATAITIGEKNYAGPGTPEPKDFIADKTFHYIIREKETDVILFMGRYY